MTLALDPIRFTVLGHPQAKGSKRALPTGGRVGARPVLVDSNRRARPWAALVTDAARQAHAGALIRGAVRLELVFYFARPQGHYGTGRNKGQLRASAPARMVVAPDVDKLARCALDALTGVLLADDRQVTELLAAKAYADGGPERLEVILW
jgi:Holliday junction resolvase RusA-like endonuclease